MEEQEKQIQQVSEKRSGVMPDDNSFTKLVRPLCLIVILATYIVFSVLAARGILPVPDKYVELLGDWGKLVMAFYFGSRSIEKIASRFGK